MTDQAIDQAKRDRRDRMVLTAVRRDSAFAAATRHGKVVRILRWAVPAVVLAGAVGFLALIYMPKSIGPVSIGQINIEANSLVMQTPRISGFDGSRRAYELKADRALQSLDNPGQVRLEQIVGTVGFGADETANVAAAVGVYDRDGERVLLSGGIDIATSTGYVARMEEAVIDLNARTLRSMNPVALTTPDGSIHGGNIEVFDSGRRFVMTEGVRVILLPDRTATASAEGLAAPPATPATP